MQVHRVAALLLVGMSLPLSAPKATQAPVAQQSPEGTSATATDVAARDDGHDRLTVGVKIAGQGPYSFLIDTGASRSAISRELAGRLGLADSDAATLYSVTGVTSVATARVPLLEWTAKQVRDVHAALLEPSNMGADGILGLDSLNSQRILFDFARNTLTVVPSNMYIPDEPGTIVVNGRARNGRLILTDATAGNTRVTLIVDTGAEISVGNRALWLKLNRGGKLQTRGPIELQSVTGAKLNGELMVLPEVEVHGVKLRGLPIFFADSALFKQLRLDDRPAMLLGMNALRGFKKVSIDISRRSLRVVLPEHSSIDRTAFSSR